MTAPITTESALSAAARMLAGMICGLVASPEGRAEIVRSLTGEATGDPAEREIVRRVAERLKWAT